MSLPALFSILCLLLVGLLLAAERRDMEILRAIAKTLASLCFVLVAMFLGAIGSAYGLAILIALIFCALGDVLLLPKAEGFFLAGMGAFGMGHVVFAISFAMTGPTANPLGLAGAGIMVLVGLTTMRWLWPHLGPMRLPVAVYTLIIGIMVAVAAAATGAGATTLILAGAAAFAISDLSVARDRLVSPSFAYRLWGLPLYYAAQLMLAWTVILEG